MFPTLVGNRTIGPALWHQLALANEERALRHDIRNEEDVSADTSLVRG
jgi:hypothetical protein